MWLDWKWFNDENFDCWPPTTVLLLLLLAILVKICPTVDVDATVDVVVVVVDNEEELLVLREFVIEWCRLNNVELFGDNESVLLLLILEEEFIPYTNPEEFVVLVIDSFSLFITGVVVDIVSFTGNVPLEVPKVGNKKKRMKKNY